MLIIADPAVETRERERERERESAGERQRERGALETSRRRFQNFHKNAAARDDVKGECFRRLKMAFNGYFSGLGW